MYSLITGGLGALGVLGVVVLLFLTDKLHTDGEFQRSQKALELEKEAHAETRKALAAASERADAAVRASELIADAFSSAGSGRRRVQKAQQ